MFQRRDFNPKGHRHGREPHHALHLRRPFRILRLEPERLQESGEKEKELCACQMLSGTRSLANGEGNEILVPLHPAVHAEEPLRPELGSSAPFLALSN